MSEMDDYQREAIAYAALSTDLGEQASAALAIRALGIAGEAGEVADLVKKHVGHGHPLDVAKLKYELGDVLWYVAGIASAVGLSLSDVAAGNLEKLRARYPEGHFSTERSISRANDNAPAPAMCGCDMMDRCAKHSEPTPTRVPRSPCVSQSFRDHRTLGAAPASCFDADAACGDCWLCTSEDA